MKHELKILPQYYFAVLNGSKTFEVRLNDRGFQNGDSVVLRYYNPDIYRDGFCSMFKSLEFKIGYVLPIDAERVVFSLLKEES